MAVLLDAFRQAQPGGTAIVQQSYLNWLEEQEQERSQKYAMFRNYYEGEHTTQLTKRMRKFLELTPDQEFSLNFCPIVVDGLAEKLVVAKFECDDQPDLLVDWWERSRMDAQQKVVHLASIRDGDTYLLVDWDNEGERPRFMQENAYDGVSGIHIVYSDEHRMMPVVAIKRWYVTSGAYVKTRRTNLYYPDRIEKYTDMGTGTSWQQHEEDGQPWPIPWTDTGDMGGKPLGIPVIHFRNKDQGYSYGESELEDVVPMANALNKSMIDLLAAADTAGFPIYTMTGGKPDTSILAPGSWAYITDPAGKIGSIAAADLTGLIALKETIVFDIARLTRTPTSNFQLTGQVAAEGTLKEQRAGLIAKARDRQTVFGNAWEDAMTMARKLYNVYGKGGLDEEVEVTVDWEDDEKVDFLTRANTVNLLNTAGAASIEQKVTILHPDWTTTQIKREVKIIRDEQGINVQPVHSGAQDATPPPTHQAVIGPDGKPVDNFPRITVKPLLSPETKPNTKGMA